MHRHDRHAPSSRAYAAMICAAYDCVTPAVAPSSALNTSCTWRDLRLHEVALEVLRNGDDHARPPRQHRLPGELHRRTKLQTRRIAPTPGAGRRCRAMPSCDPCPRRTASPLLTSNVAALDSTMSCTIGIRIICRTMSLSRKICSRLLPHHEAQRPHASLGLKLLHGRRHQHERHDAEHERLVPQLVRPTPFSMMPRAMMMNQRAGTMFVTSCSQPGMLAIGKIIPESSVLGKHGAEHRAEHRGALRCRARGDQHTERERDQRVDDALRQQKQNAPAERHMEDEPRREQRRERRSRTRGRGRAAPCRR